MSLAVLGNINGLPRELEFAIKVIPFLPLNGRHHPATKELVLSRHYYNHRKRQTRRSETELRQGRGDFINNYDFSPCAHSMHAKLCTTLFHLDMKAEMTFMEACRTNVSMNFEIYQPMPL